MPWVQGTGPEPITVAEASFQAGRLLIKRTRNSAAYKGLYALLMQAGCMDWIYSQPMNIATFLDLAVDIHHIFPKAWCDKNGVEADRRESIVNKTALSARTNRKIGGRSPAAYLPLVEAESGISGTETDKIVATHLIDPQALRTADFDTFFAARQTALLALVGAAMGKPVSDLDPTCEADAYVDDDPEPDDDHGVNGEPVAPETAGGSAVESGQPEAATTARPEDANPPVTSTRTEVDLSQLRTAFHGAMVDVYRRARTEAGYNATLFLTMVSQRGGLDTARTLLHAPKPSDGFTALWERGRLDLTVEALILQPRFEPLFTDDERQQARDRLTQYGYELRPQ